MNSDLFVKKAIFLTNKINLRYDMKCYILSGVCENYLQHDKVFQIPDILHIKAENVNIEQTQRFQTH